MAKHYLWKHKNFTGGQFTRDSDLFAGEKKPADAKR